MADESSNMYSTVFCAVMIWDHDTEYRNDFFSINVNIWLSHDLVCTLLIKAAIYFLLFFVLQEQNVIERTVGSVSKKIFFFTFQSLFVTQGFI